MSSRGKKKKLYRAEHKKKPKKKLGGISDCCGNCASRLDFHYFNPQSVRCNNNASPLYNAIMPKQEYCIAYKRYEETK